MTFASSTVLHCVPTAPAPAPSQIRFPRRPQRIRRPDLPLPGSSRSKLVLLDAQEAMIRANSQPHHPQECPAWLH